MVWDASVVFTVSGWGELGSSALHASSPFSKKAEGVSGRNRTPFGVPSSQQSFGSCFSKALKTQFLPNCVLFSPYPH